MIQRERILNPEKLNKESSKDTKKGTTEKGPIIYWMQRDQRVDDNWALLYGMEQSRNRKAPLIVVFTLASNDLEDTSRQDQFMIHGLKEVEQQLDELRVPFLVRVGNPSTIILQLIKETQASMLVTDFNPIRIHKQWNREIIEQVSIPMIEVDSHNVIPCWVTSNKQEYGAYTIRPKIHRLLSLYLTDIPKIETNPFGERHQSLKVNWDEHMQPFDTVTPPQSPSITNKLITSGARAANIQMNSFLDKGLNEYTQLRNNPTMDGQSNLSPYLHFGHISAQRVAWEVMKCEVNQESKDAFLEELIVRKELSDNYCYYNDNYDNFAGFPAWAQRTLLEHRGDERDYIYSLQEFETGQTHDAIWNRAQRELVDQGTMHGYIRMYWAKKILEWTDNPDIAQEYAIYLNDTYAIDGRDPNGYTGIAWSIGGLHDRAWKERRVFGKVRFMNESGCKRKFDVQQYIQSTR